MSPGNIDAQVIGQFPKKSGETGYWIIVGYLLDRILTLLKVFLEQAPGSVESMSWTGF